MEILGVELRPGMEAVTSDGASLGKIAALYDEEFVVEKGWFFVKDHSLRYQDVQRVSDRTVILRLNKADVEKMAAGGPGGRTERYDTVASRGGGGSTTGTSSPGVGFDAADGANHRDRPRGE